jgi:DNA polymerase-1
MAAKKTESLYIVDAHSLIFQVFHAIAQMTSPAGLPTNALFGFTRDLLFLRDDKKPDFLLCVFDHPEPTFRDKIYPEYKANRSPMPDDLRLQIPLIHQLLKAMRIPVLSTAGYEADDVIATLAVAGQARDMDVFICTSDKDCRQLITDRVCIFNLRKKEVLDAEGLLRDWNIRPSQVIDLLVLVGDTVDNVPGVPGIGIKTAAKLLNEYGTLENLMANVDKISGAKMKENLQAFRDRIETTRKLIALALDVPVSLSWEEWRLAEPNYEALVDLFQEWSFHRFADQVRQQKRSRPARQLDLFAGAGGDEPGLTGPAPVRAGWAAKYQTVDTREDAARLVLELSKQSRFAFALQTSGPSPRQAAIVGAAFSWQAGESFYLPFSGSEGTRTLDRALVLGQLKPIFEDANVGKISQNIKNDVLVLRAHGVSIQGAAGDPMVADYLLRAGERSHSIDELSNRYLDHAVIPISRLTGKKGDVAIEAIPAADMTQYAGEAADVAWRLGEVLEDKLGEEKLLTLYRDLELPLAEVLAELEFNGMRVDVALLGRLSEEMTSRLRTIESEIYELAGRSFNIASPTQLRQVMFEELKLPKQRRTGITGEASTAQVTLERLAALGHALPRKILDHRQIAKLKGTYVDALPGLVNPATGRVHAAFNQTVAATGRLSSSDPNLQNIPIRTEQGRQIRQAFVPEAGWVLLTADYSQVELRLLAHFSSDETLLQAFKEDRDIHALVAAQIFGVPEAEVTADQRRLAKTVNFGVLYGMSAHGLAQRLEMSVEDAARFIDAYFARYPRIAGYQSRLLKDCRQRRCAGTILGRRREITGIRAESTYQQRNQPEREAINMEIQGSAADLIKTAMLRIHRRLKSERRSSRMLLQIHDELVFEAPPSELPQLAALVNEQMTTALDLEVPLKVEIAAGPNWLDVEEVAA